MPRNRSDGQPEENEQVELEFQEPPDRCPEGKWVYGARVQRRGQNGLNSLKITTTWERIGTGERNPPTHTLSPIQDKKRGQAQPQVSLHAGGQEFGSWTSLNMQGTTACTYNPS